VAARAQPELHAAVSSSVYARKRAGRKYPDARFDADSDRSRNAEGKVRSLLEHRRHAKRNICKGGIRHKPFRALDDQTSDGQLQVAAWGDRRRSRLAVALLAEPDRNRPAVARRIQPN